MLIAVVTAGCSHAQQSRPITPVREKNLVFNPDRTGLPSFDVARSDWPSTLAYSAGGQYTEYEVRIEDRTGGWHRGRDDYYYRRFSSVRQGWRRP